MKLVKLLFFATLILVVPTLLSHSGGANPENSGAPGEQTCGRSSCHNVTANQGSATVSIDFNNGAILYKTDSTYTVTVSIANSSRIKHGFQISAINVANANAGTWTLTDQMNTRVRTGFTLPDRKYVTHTANGNSMTTWTMDWTAPSTDVGDVTFYAAFLQTNSNDATSGDSLYTVNLPISIDPTNSVDKIALEEVLEIYPNPTADYLFINNRSTEQLSMNIYDVTGKVVKSEQLTLNQNTIDVQGWSTGVYFVKLTDKNYSGTYKVIVH